MPQALNVFRLISEGEKFAMDQHRDWPVLQCNGLYGGHPTFFYQSRDKFRTKESEFVHFGPITNGRLILRKVYFHQ